MLHVKSVAPFLFVFIAITGNAQLDSLSKKLKFTGDFRFRIEQDWNSRKSDGSYRDDRSRLRYRLRFGANYQYNEWASFGMRIRTGTPHKQQDPQLTLGEGFKEFGTLPIGFEKAFFRAKFNSGFRFWLGKNTYPFYKQNELFWSDNVYPEGVAVRYDFGKKKKENLSIRAGHFIVSAQRTTFDMDQYFQGAQFVAKVLDQKLTLAPSFYYFNSMPDIPDGGGTYNINYSIAHLGMKLLLFKDIPLYLELDGYYNLQDYDSHDSIPPLLRDQKTGLVAGIGYGKLKEKGDWKFKLTYAYLERYSAVDFMAQNDWARWDYSGAGSPDGRLTNLQGIEAVISYAINKRFKLTAKYYHVNQLLPYGTHLETNDRFRFDLDIGF